MKGKLESSAILAASAVFPLLGGPEDEEKLQLQQLYFAQVQFYAL